MGKERRKRERFDANLFVEIENPFSGEIIGRGVVVDVSLSGLAIETEAPIEINQDLGCHVEVPLYLKAKVVRSIPSGNIRRFGLKFSDQSLLDKFLLKKILKGRRKTKKVR